jgi:flagellar biosynthesis protein FlhG
MSDQADGLRQLARERPGTIAAPTTPRARSLVFTSGKGGVGTSNLALNLAIALGEAGQRVILVDADLGLANLDLLCGLAPSCDLGDVLAGERPLADAVVAGPAGIRAVPGAHGMRRPADWLDDGPIRLLAELTELERDADVLIVDAGSGLGPGIAALGGAADEVVVVSTPEPTSLADAHAALARFRGAGGTGRRPSLRIVVNMARSRTEAAATLDRLCADSRAFSGLPLRPLGYIRHDPRVGRAVRQRRPFALEYPSGPAARCVRRMARALIAEGRPKPRRRGFFAALARPWDRLDR